MFSILGLSSGRDESIERMRERASAGGEIRGKSQHIGPYNHV